MSRSVGWNFAGLSLVTERDQQPASGWWLETYGEGWDLGAPAAQIVTRESLWLDGDDVVIDRYGNRQIPSTVVVCGRTNADLFAGHKALAVRVGQRASLVFTPPQDGPASVFDVRTSTMRYIGEDLEFARNEGQVRRIAFAMEWHCWPWALEAEISEETFTPGAGTVTTVDGCTATTNWPGFTTATYLGQSVVRQTFSGDTGDSSGWSQFDISPDAVWQFLYGSATGTFSYTGSVPSVTYVYLDIALQWDGTVDFGSMMRMRNTPSGTPLAIQAQANGFTRYFWTRPTTGQVVVDLALPSTDMTVNIDQFGTSTTLPSGSMFVLNMRGSVRVPAQLVVNGPTGFELPLGETLIYADPTMVTYGWQPDLGESYANAPEGTYWLWIQPGIVDDSPLTAYASGDVISYTLAGQTCETRVQWAGNTTPANGRWFPLGPFYLGTNRTRRLGTIAGLDDVMTFKRNGVTMEGAGKARLIRSSPDSALLHVRLNESTHSYLFVDPPTFDQPRPGVFAGAAANGSDATSVLDVVDAWNWPILQPPIACLWFQSKGVASPRAPQISLRSRAAHHTFVSDVA